MTDLERLFEASARSRPGSRVQRADEGDVRSYEPVVPAADSAQAARVSDARRLMGGPREITLGQTAALSRLLGARQETRQHAPVDLSHLFGQSSLAPAEEDRRAAAPASADLATRVGPASARPDDFAWAAPELARAGKRPRFARRKAGAVNILSIAVAIFSIVALIGVASFALVLRATANPADDAMVSLREREAELTNEIDQTRTAMDLYSASLAAANASIASARDVLPGLVPHVSPNSLKAAQAAQASLERLAAQPPSIVIPDYRRAPIDESSLVEVGRALDEVREVEDTLPTMMTEVRNARAELVAGLTAFRASLLPVGEALQTDAAERIGAATAADDSFRATVEAASAALRASQAAGGDGLSEMSAVVSALDALEAENQRVLEQRRNGTGGTTPGTAVPRSSSPPASRAPLSEPPAPAPQEPALPDPQPEPQPQPSPSESVSESANG